MVDSYEDAVAQAKAAVFRARLADPGEHFPYKHAAVCALVDENPPAGPDGPDDARVRIEDFMSRQIADATRDYVDAQAAYLADPTLQNVQRFRDATAALDLARVEHRANRRGGLAVTAIRARRAGE